MNVEYFVSKRPGYTQARRHVRVPATFPVQVVSKDLRLVDEARDLSEGGVGVATKHPLPPMTLVPMRLELPTAKEPIEILGRVMWANERAMGLRFEQANVVLTDSIERLRAAFERL